MERQFEVVETEMLNEAKHLTPRPEPWGRGRGQIYRGRTEQCINRLFNLSLVSIYT